MNIDVVVLAAGQGSRMKSALPKVLHPIAGKPMLGHVLDAARSFSGANMHVVIGHGAQHIKDAFAGQEDLSFAIQAEQLGTGHAVLQALPQLGNSEVTLILYGDVPLTQAKTLQALVALVDAKNMGLLTVVMNDATGYGRIVRNAEQQVVAIVEHKDASAAQREIREVNTGIMAVPTARLKQWLPALKNDNAQGEYYLTDIIAMAVADGLCVKTLHPEFAEETNGVNNRLQQAELERWHQTQLSRKLMEQGVTLLDPARIDIRGELICGRDVVIDINAVFEGRVELGDGVYVGPNCVIKNCVIGAGSEIEAYSHLEEATLANDCHVGPYARLRPGADLADKAKVGNFVEIKKSKIGKGSKVNHLSYIGDATLGSDVNVGAGTITCNYDGVNKFKTQIGDNAFIGSNSSLVAPVNIGAFATVGAGSTITKDVGDNNLAVARGKQVQIDHWQRPVKK